MKKINLTLLTLFIGVQVLTSCSSDKQEENNADTATVAASSTSASTVEKVEKTENGPASYDVAAMPDSAILGKDREALVKIMDMNVLELTDADGNSTGSELTVKLSVTNKSKLDAKKYFTLDPSEARLELDNKTSIPSSDSNGNTSPQAESTSESTWTFTLPANTKPAKLNFFMSGTRVGVNLSPQA